MDPVLVTAPVKVRVPEVEVTVFSVRRDVAPTTVKAFASEVRVEAAVAFKFNVLVTVELAANVAVPPVLMDVSV